MRVRYSFSSRRTGNIDNIRKQRTPFPKMVRKVVEISDIILEVLDARFIDETRNLELEKFIRKEGKKLIFVLNKSDLVNIEEKKIDLQKRGITPFVFVSCKDRRGAGALRERIKIEASRLKVSDETKQEIIDENPKVNMNEELKRLDYKRKQVGVIGYPNTGKSSLINFLTRRGAAKTAAESGFTKGIQKVRLNKDILVLDTPGVIPDKEYSVGRDKVAHHAKLGVRTYDRVKDPEYVVLKLVEQYKDALQDYYNVKAEDSEKLIEEVGKKKNLLIKGGEVDVDRAARFILREWQEGKIRV